MQRLDALFAFIENKFSVDQRFFDVKQLARVNQLVDAGIVRKAPEGSSVLSPIECASFLDYTLAVTEFPSVDENAVNDIFSRINAYGRQLSDQEKRQAGVVSGFAALVRELAAEIRGDVSQDTLDLSEMPAFSVDISGESLNYGVHAEETFWCKQGILRKNQLRDSEDEQLLADFAISVLEREPFAFSGKSMDSYYDLESDNSKRINNLLALYGSETLKNEIKATISIIRETVESQDSSPNFLRRLLHPQGQSNPIKTAFYAVFFAFFELCVRQKKTPDAIGPIFDSLKGLHSKMNVSAGAITSAARRQNINLTVGLIQSFFVEKEPPAIFTGTGNALSFENALRRSRIETSAYECKQGIVQLLYIIRWYWHFQQENI